MSPFQTRRFCAALLLCVLVLPLGLHAQEPFIPNDDALVLEHVLRARGASPESQHLQDLQAQQRAAPEDLSKALAFARESISLGNEEADPRYYGYAQAALRPWWARVDTPADVRVLRAVILQWRHEFGPARADLVAVIKADGEGVQQAHLTLATIEMVQGDPLAARHDCAALIGHTDLLTATVCIASANALMGRAAAMRGALESVLAQAKDAVPSARIWGRTEVAEIDARIGDLDGARVAYDAALAEMTTSGHRDPYLLASAADFLIDVGQPRQAIALLAGLERIDNLLLRLARANAVLARQGDSAAAAELPGLSAQIESRFAETRARGDFIHQRERAMYLLYIKDQPSEALTVAESNWQNQREPLDARVLLEASIAGHRATAARPVLDWMAATGIEDADLKSLAARLTTTPSSP